MGRLSGLTIDIGGNSSKLNDALKEPNKNAKDLQAKLKEVNTALKLDPKNVELLAQKQDLLKQSVGETTEKLNILKKSQQEFKDSGGDLNSKAYIQLQTDIAKTEASLKSLKDQQTNVSATFQSTASSLKDFGNKATSAGKSMLPVTAGITAFGAVSVKAFNDVDEAADTIVEKTGATGESMGALKKVFEDVATSIPADLNEVGNAVGEINTRLGFTGDTLKNASIDFLKFAKINKIDVNSAVTLVSRAMGDAGMDASKYGTMLDMLTKASQASGIGIDKLTESITKYGAPMRTLGYNTAESIALFSQFEKAGVTTEIAFSGMKIAMNKWIADGKNAKVEFANLIKGIQNGTISAAEATSVFGKKASADMIDAIQGGKFSLEDFLTVVEGSKGAVSSTFEETEDGIDNMKLASNSAKIAFASMGESISSVLGPILKGLADIMKKVADWLNSIPEGARNIIVIIGLLVAAIGPILMLVGSISSGIAALMPILSAASGLFGVLGGVIGAISWPVLAVVAAVAALIAIGVALYKNWDEVSKWASETWNTICNTIGNFMSDLTSNLVEGWRLIGETISTKCEEIKNWVVEKFTAIVDWFKQLPSTLWQIGSDMFNNMKEGIVSTISNVKHAIESGIQSAIDFITGLPQKALTWGGDMINGFVNGIKGAIGNVKKAIGNVVDTITSFLHFSRPDEGPLRQYETWMPDFMQGLAKGINDNIGLIKGASANIASTLTIDPNRTNNVAQSNFMGSISGLKESIVSALNNNTSNASNETYVFPIYVGNKLADSFVLDATMRNNVRSGGH